MTRGKVAWGAGLMVVLLVIAGGRAQDPGRARLDFLAFLSFVEVGKEAPKQATDLAAKHELVAVMGLLRPRDKGGLGVGDKGPASRRRSRPFASGSSTERT